MFLKTSFLLLNLVGEVKELDVSGTMNKPRFRKREKKSSAKPPLPRRDHMPQQLKNVEPPAEYLQEDISESIDQRLPPEVVGLLQNMRMFGCFEKPLFLELIKHISTVYLKCNQHLFMIGNGSLFFLSLFFLFRSPAQIKLPYQHSIRLWQFCQFPMQFLRISLVLNCTHH